MRKLINSTYVTLDGVIENPMWTSPYFDEEAGAFAGSQTDAADAIRMGRVLRVAEQPLGQGLTLRLLRLDERHRVWIEGHPTTVGRLRRAPAPTSRG